MIRRLLGLTLLLATLPAAGQALDKNEQQMVEWIDAHAEDAIALLEETVNISSGTMNHAGVREVGRAMRRELEQLGEVRGEEHLTFNVGTILGGTDVTYDPQQNHGSAFGKTNVVPRKTIVHGGMRTISLEPLERTRDAMRAIVAESLPHTSASIEFAEGYPPMFPTQGNRSLEFVLSAINEALGRGPMQELDPSMRGAADVSFVAPYTDAIAGLGALADGGHTPNESLDLTSLPLAIKRAAILIYRISDYNE